MLNASYHAHSRRYRCSDHSAYLCQSFTLQRACCPRRTGRSSVEKARHSGQRGLHSSPDGSDARNTSDATLNRSTIRC